MSSLADLFSVEDLQTRTKGSKAKKGGADKKKGQKGGNSTAKSVRYPLPVRVCHGHVRLVLASPEFTGKTVGEDEIKKKIRGNFPELSGIDIGLVKFENSHTMAIEAVEKKRFEEKTKISGDDPEETEDSPETDAPETGEEPDSLDIASAEDELTEDDEGLPEDEAEDDDLVGDESPEADDSDGDDGEDDDSGAAKPASGYGKGCWIKLDIHYREQKDPVLLEYPVTVKVGGVSREYGEEYDSLAAIREHWVGLHPEYDGCLFHYDERQGLLLPFMRGENEIKGKKYKLPLSVGYLGLTEHYEAGDFGDGKADSVTMHQVRELYARKYPEYGNAIFAYHEKDGCLFPVVNFKQSDADALYSIPVKVRGGGFSLELESSDFNGKTEATLEEIRKALEVIYPEFSKERTEMIYDERGFVIPVLKGSRKGYRVTGSAPGRCLIHTAGRNGMTYRVEQTPFGFFDCREDGKEVDFRLNAPKIPGALLREIISFFKEDPDREAAVQIFYDPGSRTYELYYPPQKTSAAYVAFERNALMEEEKALVMDVHSHNRMRAFFSSVDDLDEKGTRLYLVIGRIDREPPMWCARAGIAGHYKTLELSDIFTMEEIGYGLYEN